MIKIFIIPRGSKKGFSFEYDQGNPVYDIPDNDYDEIETGISDSASKFYKSLPVGKNPTIEYLLDTYDPHCLVYSAVKTLIITPYLMSNNFNYEQSIKICNTDFVKYLKQAN